jgi:uncharacterized membrane protein
MPLGSYTLTVTATGGGRTHTASPVLVVVEPDFTLTASPASKMVAQGKSGTYTISAAGLFGSTGTAYLSVSGAPAGVTATLSRSSVSLGYSVTLTVATTTTVPFGSYTLTVTGTALGKTRTASAELVVVEPDFQLTLTPASLTVAQGKSAAYTVSAKALYGSTGTAYLSVSGAPAGTTATLGKTSLSFGYSTTLTLAAATTTTPGTYTMTVTATGVGKTHSTSADLVIVVPDFSFSVSPGSASVARGSSASFTVSAAAINMFSGTISLSVMDLPLNTSASFSRSSISTTGSVTLKLTPATTTPPGTYTVTVKGVSGAIVHTAPISLTVT